MRGFKGSSVIFGKKGNVKLPLPSTTLILLKTQRMDSNDEIPAWENRILAKSICLLLLLE
jgi:hypothetical protein